MKIALFGASGTIGQRILTEALARGHQVTAIVRNPATIKTSAGEISAIKGDALNPTNVAETVTGHDLVISAISPDQGGSVEVLVQAANSLLEGVKQAGVERLLIVGGAGSLEVAPGVQLVDTDAFPAAWKPLALAHRDALDVYRTNDDLNWTYFSPAAFIAPGERTGQYRTGTDQLLSDDQGQSRISTEDFAIALLDEVENPRFSRRRLTVAY